MIKKIATKKKEKEILSLQSKSFGVFSIPWKPLHFKDYIIEIGKQNYFLCLLFYEYSDVNFKRSCVSAWSSSVYLK